MGQTPLLAASFFWGSDTPRYAGMRDDCRPRRLGEYEARATHSG